MLDLKHCDIKFAYAMSDDLSIMEEHKPEFNITFLLEWKFLFFVFPEKKLEFGEDESYLVVADLFLGSCMNRWAMMCMKMVVERSGEEIWRKGVHVDDKWWSFLVFWYDDGDWLSNGPLFFIDISYPISPPLLLSQWQAWFRLWERVQNSKAKLDFLLFSEIT